MNPNANIGRHLGDRARARPQGAALKVPRGRTPGGDIDYLSLTFAELDAEVGAWAGRLAARGIGRGDRTLIMVRPGLPLIASVFALFRIGAVPVVIDPGMRLSSFLECVRRTQPRALVGLPLAQLISRVLRRDFRSVAIRVPASSSLVARIGPGGPAIADSAIAHCAAGDPAAILFTSGSTGSPKGVRYDHGMFEAQVRLIRDTYEIAPGEVDLPLLPVFALFNPALGMTTVVPELDPRRPAAADPAAIVQAIRQEKVTNSFGSPTLWRIIFDHCRARGITLPGLRRVLCAGAPVPASVWSDAPVFLPNGRLHSPYGATEALPVSSISNPDLRSTGGAPVGRPLSGISVKIIALSDEPIAALGDARELPDGDIGEIIVSGPVVSREYDSLPEATRRAKIRGPGGEVWHRMGDCGFRDAAGALWFCGRAAERVETPSGTMHTEPCERVFRAHPRAARCALIGLGPRGNQVPAIVAEARAAGAADAAALAAELGALAAAHPQTSAITRFYFNPRFPMDVRHNAKIHRLALARWAAAATAHETGGPAP